MKIYAGNENSSFECSEVELLCTKKELDVLIDLLLKFQGNINEYLEKNKDQLDLGFTHMHYQDNNELWKKGDVDVVFYVDLNN